MAFSLDFSGVIRLMTSAQIMGSSKSTCPMARGPSNDPYQASDSRAAADGSYQQPRLHQHGKARGNWMVEPVFGAQ
jgi:hypothetical protein